MNDFLNRFIRFLCNEFWPDFKSRSISIAHLGSRDKPNVFEATNQELYWIQRGKRVILTELNKVFCYISDVDENKSEESMLYVKCNTSYHKGVEKKYKIMKDPSRAIHNAMHHRPHPTRDYFNENLILSDRHIQKLSEGDDS